MTRSLYKVTVKVALYAPGREKVLLTEMGKGNYGLPGGHIEENESPDEALQREIKEELGLTLEISRLEKKDFWFHPEGKLVLAYVSELDPATKLTLNETELSDVKWVLLTDIRSGAISAGTYDDFVLANGN